MMANYLCIEQYNIVHVINIINTKIHFVNTTNFAGSGNYGPAAKRRIITRKENHKEGNKQHGKGRYHFVISCVIYV